jgi:hypothetical protein
MDEHRLDAIGPPRPQPAVGGTGGSKIGRPFWDTDPVW